MRKKKREKEQKELINFNSDHPFKLGEKVKFVPIKGISDPNFDLFVVKLWDWPDQKCRWWVSLGNGDHYSAIVPITSIIKIKED